MNTDPAVEAAIRQYLDAVAVAMSIASSPQREAVLQELREHIDEAMHARANDQTPTLQDAYAVLAEMDPPETYSDNATPAAESNVSDMTLNIVALVCGLVTIACSIASFANVPVLPAIGGFAMIISFLTIRTKKGYPRWIIRLMGFAAICGVGLILMEVAGAL